MARFNIPEIEFDITYARSGGAGGQNVNKVNSKAVLRWNVATCPFIPDDVRERFMAKYAARITADGDIVIHSSNHRDQPKNRAAAIARLHEMLDSVADAPVERVATEPTQRQKQKRLDSKKRDSRKKAERRRQIDW